MSLESELRELQRVAREAPTERGRAAGRGQVRAFLLDVLDPGQSLPPKVRARIENWLRRLQVGRLLNDELSTFQARARDIHDRWEVGQKLFGEERDTFYPKVYLEAQRFAEPFLAAHFDSISAWCRMVEEEKLLDKLVDYYDCVSSAVPAAGRRSWLKKVLTNQAIDHVRSRACHVCRSVPLTGEEPDETVFEPEELLFGESEEDQGQAREDLAREVASTFTVTLAEQGPDRSRIARELAKLPACARHINKVCPDVDLLENAPWHDREAQLQRLRDHARTTGGRKQDAREKFALRRIPCFDWFFYLGSRKADPRPEGGYQDATYFDPATQSPTPITGRWTPFRKKSKSESDLALIDRTEWLIGPSRYHLLSHIRLTEPKQDGVGDERPQLVSSDYSVDGVLHIYTATAQGEEPGGSSWAYEDLRLILRTQRPDVVDWLRQKISPPEEFSA